MDAGIEQLYVRFGRAVWRRAVTLLGDREAAEDVVQEVFLRAAKASERQSFEPNPMGWLYRVTTNLCLRMLRDGKRRQRLLSRWTFVEETSEIASASALAKRILQEIPEDLQDVAIYYYIDGLSQEEISEVTGVSRRTIGNRIVRFHSLVDKVLTGQSPRRPAEGF